MSPKLLSLTALATLFITPAFADTLPDVPASCFTYSLGNAKTSPHALAASSLHGTLTGTGLTLDVGPMTLTDSKNEITGEKLTQFNASMAYAALSAFHGGISSTCQNANPGITDKDIRNGTPEITWSHIKLARPGHTLTVEHAIIHAVETTPDLHLKISGSGIHDSKQPLVPSSLNTDLTIQNQTRITINSLKAQSGNSTITGTGTIQAGTSAATSTADTQIGVTNVDGLINNIRQSAPNNVITALTVARLMGHQNGNTTNWDITLQGGVVTINRIPLPIAMPH